MRRDFSANVSHEMKTPLQVISLRRADEKRHGSPEDTQKFAGLIYDESKAMRALIDHVLTLSRLDESAFERDSSTPVDLLVVANRASTRLRTLAGRALGARDDRGRERLPSLETRRSSRRCSTISSRTAFDTTTRAGRFPVRLQRDQRTRRWRAAACEQFRTRGAHDAGRLRRARCFSGGGRPRDRHRPASRPKSARRCSSAYRMEKSRSKETGGTGLGLAIRKHAVLYHHGTIAVDGEVGKGSIFTSSLPRRCSHPVKGGIVKTFQRLRFAYTNPRPCFRHTFCDGPTF